MCATFHNSRLRLRRYRRRVHSSSCKNNIIYRHQRMIRGRRYVCFFCPSFGDDEKKVAPTTRRAARSQAFCRYVASSEETRSAVTDKNLASKWCLVALKFHHCVASTVGPYTIWEIDELDRSLLPQVAPHGEPLVVERSVDSLLRRNTFSGHS